MTSSARDISQFHLLEIHGSDAWKVTRHRLFDVSPDAVPHLSPPVHGFTVWDLYFLENLFQAERIDRSLLLDIGWYPHADPSGCFRLFVVRITESGRPSRNDVDWNHPVAVLETRSLREVHAEICRWLTNDFSASRRKGHDEKGTTKRGRSSLTTGDEKGGRKGDAAH